MKIILLGYMASGKSTVAKAISKQLTISYLDLDDLIASKTGMSVTEIFQSKGELFFRKQEHEVLKECLSSSSPMILSLGGGTPCYYNNIQLIKEAKDATSFYLKASIPVLLERLWKEKESRPLIAHSKSKDELEEFIRKHVFERQFYYMQAHHVVDVSAQEIEKIAQLILAKTTKNQTL